MTCSIHLTVSSVDAKSEVRMLSIFWSVPRSEAHIVTLYSPTKCDSPPECQTFFGFYIKTCNGIFTTQTQTKHFGELIITGVERKLGWISCLKDPSVWIVTRYVNAHWSLAELKVSSKSVFWNKDNHLDIQHGLCFFLTLITGPNPYTVIHSQ